MSEMRAPYRLLGPRLHLLVVLAAALAVAAPPFTVLCHGEDGHLALESAFDTCCRELAVPVTAGTQVGESRRGDTCGRCTDVWLDAPAAVSPPPARPLQALCALPASGAVPQVSGFLVRSRGDRASTPHLRQPRELIATTVLTL